MSYSQCYPWVSVSSHVSFYPVGEKTVRVTFCVIKDKDEYFVFINGKWDDDVIPCLKNVYENIVEEHIKQWPNIETVLFN